MLSLTYTMMTENDNQLINVSPIKQGDELVLVRPAVQLDPSPHLQWDGSGYTRLPYLTTYLPSSISINLPITTV